MLSIMVNVLGAQDGSSSTLLLSVLSNTICRKIESGSLDEGCPILQAAIKWM